MATKGQKLLLAAPTLLVAEGVSAAAHGGGVGAILAFGIASLAYAYADEIGEVFRQGDSATGPASPKESGRQALKRLGYQLLNGKSTRSERWDEQTEALEADDVLLPPAEDGSFTFSQVLATGWQPSYEQIFLARLEDGTDIFVSVEQLVHIALAGSTRQGKTSIIRQLLLQLCSVGCCCVLLDPHYTPYDIETNEDWTPFLRHLRFDPLECKSYRKIEQITRYVATTLLEHRKQLRAQMQPVGRPTFLLLDEYPAIVTEVPAVEKYVAKLLREGAKYKLFLCVASSDFQVKTIAAQTGGAIRDSYRTCLYVGGDPTTAKVLLDKAVQPAMEAILGKGSVLLRCAVVKEACLARTAYTDNQALYQLLGPSTYQPLHRQHALQDNDPPVERSKEGDFEEELDDGEKHEPQLERLPEVAKRDQRRKAEEIDLKVAITLWNGGCNSRAKLARALDIAENQAGKLMALMGVSHADGRTD